MQPMAMGLSELIVSVCASCYIFCVSVCTSKDLRLALTSSCGCHGMPVVIAHSMAILSCFFVGILSRRRLALRIPMDDVHLE